VVANPSVGGDSSNSVVTATGGSSARKLKDHFADVVNVKDYGAKGDGIDDSAAVAAALVAGASRKAAVYFPGGTYVVDQIVLGTGARLVGEGRYKTTLKPKNPNASLIYVDRDAGTSTGYATEIHSLGLIGTSSGTGHGIETTANNQGAFGLTLKDIRVENFGGDGIHVEKIWSSHFEDVWVSAPGGDAFFVRNPLLGVTLVNCYARAVKPTTGVGYRIVNGYATLIGCNGLDSGAFWGEFGRSVAMGDPENGFAHVTMIGNNLEDATDTALVVKNQSEVSFFGNSFVAPAAGTVRAVRFRNLGLNQTSVWGPGNFVTSKGASWLNGQPIHATYQPFVRFGRGTDFLSIYYETGGYSTNVPVVMQGDVSNPVTRLRGGVVISDNETTGAQIKKHLSAIVSYEFPDTVSGSASETTVTVTGAETGDVVSLGVPAGAMTAATGACGFTAWVSAADTVTIRFWNASGANKNPGNGTFRVDVWQHY
jgi:hypothetical protein